MKPITHEKVSVFIPINEVREEFDFSTFINPMSYEMWGMVIVAFIVIGITHYFTCFIHESDKMKIIEVLEYFILSMTANLGHYLSFIKGTKSLSYKITLFISLLSGNILWMAYQGSLTSELANKKLQLPFVDLKSLSESDWSLVTDFKSTSTGKIFANSEAGGEFHKVYINNMNEQSFQSKEERWNGLHVRAKTALFDIENNVPESEKCNVSTLHPNIDFITQAINILLISGFESLDKSYPNLE